MPAVLQGLRLRRLAALIPLMHRAEHGSGLGKFRYVVERTLAWFGNFRRLKICYERTGKHFQALHELAAAVICSQKLDGLKQRF